MRKYLLVFILFVLYKSGYSQYFYTGQEPASIRWRQINSSNFQIIYPDYYENQAQILARKMEQIYPYGSYSLRHNPGKIPIVLHTGSVQTNGLVAWAPSRSEFFTTYGQSLYPQDWIEQLAIHEFRHIVQIDKVHSRLSLLYRTLLGEQGTALVFGLYFPWWLIEGDAVVSETVLSNYGRGRYPSFLMEYRAQLIEKEEFSYDKAYMGSYRDFVPDHYKLGYLLAGNLRYRYGEELNEELFGSIGKNPLSLTPVRRVLKRRTEKSISGNYESIFDSLKRDWRIEDLNFQPVKSSNVTTSQKGYTNYIYNGWLNDSTIISLKSSLNSVPAFKKIFPDGSEKGVVVPGSIFSESARISGDRIVWSEPIVDLRWHHSGRSIIHVFDHNSGIHSRVKLENMAFSPVLSADGERIAFIESNRLNQHFLVIYNLITKEYEKQLQVEEGYHFLSPEWIDHNRLAVVKLTASGKELHIINMDTAVSKMIYGGDGADLKQLRADGEWLWFISSFSGKNGLYRIGINGGEVEQVIDPRFGIDYPAISPNGEQIVVSDYTADGYRLIKLSIDSLNFIPIGKVLPGVYHLADSLAKQEPGVVPFTDQSTPMFASQQYSKTANLFRFHSRAPLFIDSRHYEISPGVSFMSQNTLGTAYTTLGYIWDQSEKSGRTDFKYSFLGWYPMLDIHFSNGSRASKFMEVEYAVNSNGELVVDKVNTRNVSWGQTVGELTLWLPLNLSRGRYRTLLQTEAQSGFVVNSRKESTPEKFKTGSFYFWGLRIYFQHLLRQSLQDLFPDFGFTVDGSIRQSPRGSYEAGDLKAIQSTLFLPGVLKNHGIKLYGGLQTRSKLGEMGFSDLIRLARGWERSFGTELFTTNIDYKFPLCYPDQNVGGLLYLKRISIDLFADYSLLKSSEYREGLPIGYFSENFRSMGTEITFDLNILRFYAPIITGVRTSYLPQRRSMFYEFLFSVDFTSFL